MTSTGTSFSALSPTLRELLLQHAQEDLERARAINDLEQAATFLRPTICDDQRILEMSTTEIDEPPMTRGTCIAYMSDNHSGRADPQAPSEAVCLEAGLQSNATLDFDPFSPLSSSSSSTQRSVDPAEDSDRADLSSAQSENLFAGQKSVCLPIYLNGYCTSNAPPWFTWCSIRIVRPQGTDTMGLHSHLRDGAPMALICNYEAKGHSPTCFGMQPNHGGCLLCCYTGYLGIFSSFLV